MGNVNGISNVVVPPANASIETLNSLNKKEILGRDFSGELSEALCGKNKVLRVNVSDSNDGNYPYGCIEQKDAINPRLTKELISGKSNVTNQEFIVFGTGKTKEELKTPEFAVFVVNNKKGAIPMPEGRFIPTYEALNQPGRINTNAILKAMEKAANIKPGEKVI